MRLLITFAACFLSVAAVHAQQDTGSLGSIATHDALVSGGLQVQGDRAQLLTNVSVTAYSHTAPIDLARGGDVLVCSTSRFHLQRSGKEALVFALDRGAIEIHSDSQSQDVVMTPDLRMTFATAGRLDLRLRVTPNGDTCVENTGKSAPEISVSDAFSDSSYHLKPGQHVLFEHGSLTEVVDQETSSCGCPASTPPPVEVTQSGSNQPSDVAARNPFPSAVSQGLAPEAKPVTAPAEPKQPESTATLAYSETPEATPAPIAATASISTPLPPSASAAPPASPPGAHDIAHAISRFFHKLFHGGSDTPKS